MPEVEPIVGETGAEWEARMNAVNRMPDSDPQTIRGRLQSIQKMLGEIKP